MNYPPIFRLCSTDTDVSKLLGAGADCRLYPFGMAPQPPVKPYAVWQVIAGSPVNYLACRPDAERHVLQVDVYADSATQARACSAVIERAIELDCYVTSYRGETRDAQTKNYRSSFDCEWHTYR